MLECCFKIFNICVHALPNLQQCYIKTSTCILSMKMHVFFSPGLFEHYSHRVHLFMQQNWDFKLRRVTDPQAFKKHMSTRRNGLDLPNEHRSHILISTFLTSLDTIVQQRGDTHTAKDVDNTVSRSRRCCLSFDDDIYR
jgi:hypothetical protein